MKRLFFSDEEKNGNGKGTEKLNDNEIEELINNKPCFPCLLNGSDKGEIESNLNCLKRIPKEKIIFYKENKKEDLEITSDKNNISKISAIFFSSNFLPEIFSELVFNSELKNISGEKNSFIYQITKYKLLSININEEDLSFNEKFINEFEEISKSDESDEEKANKIENIFKRTGFYIPLKIYLGGIFSYKNENSKTVEKQNKENSMNVIDFCMGVKNYFFSNNKNSYNDIKIIGGDVHNFDKEKWIKTINLENSNVIEYSNLISSQNILSLELRNKLKKPLKMIEEKYDMRKCYFELVNELKNQKFDFMNKENYENFDTGIQQECNKPKIYLETIKIFVDTSYFQMWKSKIFEKKFNDIIVGFKIIGNRKENYYNGKWTILNNPILSKEIKIKFVSQLYRVINYKLEIYLMKTPQ